MIDHFKGNMRHSIEALEIPASFPRGSGEKPDPLLSPQEEERLRSEAAREARKWEPCARTKRGRTLETKGREAAGSIRAVSTRLRQLAPEGRELSPEAQWFRDNARLLTAALREPRGAAKAARNPPRVKAEQGS